MYLLDTTYIRDVVDYSFGDESGSTLPCGYIRPVSELNKGFIRKYQELKGVKPYMTLFVDNLRLYTRPWKYTAIEQDRSDWKQRKDNKARELAGQDLLKLCASMPDMDFIIFTGFEDTPITKDVHEHIPGNVKAVYATNCPEAHGGKVYPMPYGLQRKLHQRDIRHDVLVQMMSEEIEPKKLLYLNHSTFTNPCREQLNTRFEPCQWATVSQPQRDYRNYLTAIKLHKFMLCPEGNAIGNDCHRDWEVLYMRRVPVIEYSPYKEKLFEGCPVLFVNDFKDVTEDLLQKNNHLYLQALKFNRNTLDISLRYKKIIHDADLHYQPAAQKRQVTKDNQSA